MEARSGQGSRTFAALAGVAGSVGAVTGIAAAAAAVAGGSRVLLVGLAEDILQVGSSVERHIAVAAVGTSAAVVVSEPDIAAGIEVATWRIRGGIRNRAGL